MKKEIEQFKKENGNVTYSAKELIGGLHVKIDDINLTLRSGEGKIGAIREGLKNLKWIMGGFGIVLLTIITIMIKGVI